MVSPSRSSSCPICRYAIAAFCCSVCCNIIAAFSPATIPCGSPLGFSLYSYWFFLLYSSVISRSFLNFSTLSAFIFPAFITFLFALSQFKWSCSSILCLDGFRWFISINSITSSYLANHRSSCVTILSCILQCNRNPPTISC